VPPVEEGTVEAAELREELAWAEEEEGINSLFFFLSFF
jgi:hypothetical protein